MTSVTLKRYSGYFWDALATCINNRKKLGGASVACAVDPNNAYFIELRQNTAVIYEFDNPRKSRLIFIMNHSSLKPYLKLHDWYIRKVMDKFKEVINSDDTH